MQNLLNTYRQCRKSLTREVSSCLLFFKKRATNTLLIFTPSEAELSALREERGDNNSARPLVWLVELFLD